MSSPFTDMIYSAAHKKSSAASLGKKSTPTASANTTPRKSSRIQAKSEDESEAPTTTSTAVSGSGSYAAVAAHEPSSEGAENVTTPKKEPRMNAIRRSARKSRGGATSGSDDEIVATASGSASPARVTRSRSKGRTMGSGEE